MDESLKCAVCKTAPLQAVSLEDGLRAFQCGVCGGIWLPATYYLDWLARRQPEEPEPAATCEPLPVDDVEQVTLCPADAHLLSRYSVGHGVTFPVDRCGACNGVWLGKNEWQSLKGQGLHDEIHCFFTEPWQRQVRAEEHRRALDAMYTRKLGAEGYAELRRIRAWIESHPERAAILAYLADEDPYGP